MTTNQKTQSITAEAFLADAKAHGFRVSVKLGLVTIHKTFEPGDTAAYVTADGDGPAVLSGVPVTGPGSTWGTDGASVGGAAGLSGGYYRLNVSGVSKRFTNALTKLVGS